MTFGGWGSARMYYQTSAGHVSAASTPIVARECLSYGIFSRWETLLLFRGMWAGGARLRNATRLGSGLYLLHMLAWCAHAVKEREAARQAPYRWVARVRWDMHFFVPVPSWRVLDSYPAGVWTVANYHEAMGGTDDRFALLPRSLLEAYSGGYAFLAAGSRARKSASVHRR